MSSIQEGIFYIACKEIPFSSTHLQISKNGLFTDTSCPFMHFLPVGDAWMPEKAYRARYGRMCQILLSLHLVFRQCPLTN